MKQLLLLGAFLSLTALGAPAQDGAPVRAHKKADAKAASAPTNNVLKTAAVNGQFKTLVSLVVAADLDEVLKGKGPFTVFAPTDEAFAQLPPGTIETLLKPENKALLQSVLLYHVVPGKDAVPYRHITPGASVEFKTANGANLKVTAVNGAYVVNEAPVNLQNVACTNGSVQVIGAVLMPPKKGNSIVAVAEKAGKFKTLLAALTAAELKDVLGGKGDFTVFAPTDEAFAKLPKGTVESLLKPENRDQLVAVLKYHVLGTKLTAKDLVQYGALTTLQGENVNVSIKSGRVTVNQSGIEASDVAADNGIVHVIDRVLIPGAR